MFCSWRIECDQFIYKYTSWSLGLYSERWKHQAARYFVPWAIWESIVYSFVVWSFFPLGVQLSIWSIIDVCILCLIDIPNCWISRNIIHRVDVWSFCPLNDQFQAKQCPASHDKIRRLWTCDFWAIKLQCSWGICSIDSIKLRLPNVPSARIGSWV